MVALIPKPPRTLTARGWARKTSRRTHDFPGKEGTNSNAD